MFSNRLPGHAEVNALSQAVASLMAAGTAFVDLTAVSRRFVTRRHIRPRALL
jgi:hypothetical protein